MIAAGRRSNVWLIASAIRSGSSRLGAERLDEQTDRLGLADGVRDLHLDLGGEPRRDDILGHPPHRVARGSVNLRRVLAGERPAAVAGVATVGVDDDLAAGEPGVTHGSTGYEPPGRVDQQPVAVGVDVEAGEHWRDDVLLDIRLEQRVEIDVLGVLARDHDRVEADGLVAVVLDRHLGLAVGPQIRHDAALAHRGEPLGQPVRQPDRHGHELRRVVASEAEHEALVPRALSGNRVVGTLDPSLVGGVDALRDVR